MGVRVVDPNASEQAGAEGVDLVAWVSVVDKAAWKARKKEASKPITSKWDRYLVIERLFNSFSTLGWTFCTKKWCAFASIPPRAYSFDIRSYRPRSIPTTILLGILSISIAYCGPRRAISRPSPCSSRSYWGWSSSFCHCKWRRKRCSSILKARESLPTYLWTGPL